MAVTSYDRAFYGAAASRHRSRHGYEPGVRRRGRKGRGARDDIFLYIVASPPTTTKIWIVLGVSDDITLAHPARWPVTKETGSPET